MIANEAFKGILHPEMMRKIYDLYPFKAIKGTGERKNNTQSQFLNIFLSWSMPELTVKACAPYLDEENAPKTKGQIELKMSCILSV